VAIYDPYKDKMVEIIEYPGITRSASEHIGGVAWDKYSGLITILVDSAPPWATNGADVSGDNLVMKYDPVARKTLWTTNLTAVSKGKYGGFQDVEHDRRGNTYVVGTWPSSILRIDRDAKHVVPWYPPQTTVTTDRGYGGLAAAGEVLLTNDGDGQIYRFDMRDDKGTPKLVPISPKVLYNDTDGIYLPPVYGGTVLLVSSHDSGIQVLRSTNSWRTAEHLGTIKNPSNAATNGSQVTAAVQMGSNSVYIIDEFFTDTWVTGQTAGNRSVFPMPDITHQIKELIDDHDDDDDDDDDGDD